MKRMVRQVSRSGYQKLAKPLLFRQHPDKAHEGMIKAARAGDFRPKIQKPARDVSWAGQELRLAANS